MDQATRFVEVSLKDNQDQIAYVREEADRILEGVQLTPGSGSLRDYVASVIVRVHANLDHMDWKDRESAKR